MKINVPIVGFIIGLFLPLIGILIVCLVWRGHNTMGEYMTYVIHQKGLAAKVVLLGTLANLIPFVYFNMKRIDYAMRGVFVITMLYALLIVLLMFIWN